MVLPTSAIMYASGQSTDNSDGSSTGGETTDNSGSSTTTDNSGSSTTGGGTISTPKSNTNTLATTSTASDNTGNAQQQSSNTRNLRIGPCPYNENITCDNPEPINDTNTTSPPYVVNKNSSAYLAGYNDAISYTNGGCVSLPNTTSVQNDCGNGYLDGIYKFGDPTFQQSADYVKGMLAAHNRERAAVGAQPLVWNDKLAIGAKAWAEHLSPTGELVHDYGNVQGENIANNVAYGPREWINEKPGGHYTVMVDPSFTSVGCGFVSYPHDIIVCRYSTGVLSQ